MPLFNCEYFLLSLGTCGYLTAARLKNETSVSIGFENPPGVIIAFSRRRLWAGLGNEIARFGNDAGQRLFRQGAPACLKTFKGDIFA